MRKSTYHPDTSITTHTKWSRVSKFCTALPSIRVINKKKASGFWLKMPKIKGITKYKIYMVYDRKNKEKKSQNYKLYCTMKPGKKKKIKKYKGKSLNSKSGMYYIKVVPYKKKTKVPGYGTLNKTYDCVYMVY